MHVMRDAWCVFVLGSLWGRSTRITRAYQYGSTMTSFYWFSRVPSKILACDQGSTTYWPIYTLHSLLLLFMLLLWWLIYSDVIDDRYLEKLTNLVEEHPALYNTLLKEYKDNIRIGNIWDSIAEAMDVQTLIFRYIRCHVPVCKISHRRSALGGSFSKNNLDASRITFWRTCGVVQYASHVCGVVA